MTDDKTLAEKLKGKVIDRVVGIDGWWDAARLEVYFSDGSRLVVNPNHQQYDEYDSSTYLELELSDG